MKRIAKKFFHQFDMFSSYATFRTKGQQHVSNTCAGILSFVILILFIYVFIAQFVQTLNWQSIQATQTQTNIIDNTRKIENFMVAVGVEGFRIQGIAQFIRFQIIQVTKNGSNILQTRTLKTEKCQQYHWAQLGSDIKASYETFNLKNKLCLVLGQNFSIEQPTNGVYKTLQVQANGCLRKNRNGTPMYTGCALMQMVLYRNNLWVQLNKYFVIDVVYLNTALNPLSKSPTSKYLDRSRLTFTVKQGSQAFISLSTFKFQTDQSIMPFQEIHQQQGYTVQKITTNNYEVVWYFQHVSCTFMLGSASILIERGIGKIDQLLSYVGGLFGIIITFLGIFMGSFNKYRYELIAAQSAFTHDNQGKKVKEEDFNFFVYCKYTIFQWIKTLTCNQINWKHCKLIDQTRDQVNSQLDIAYMFKKIQYFQRFIQYIITDKQKVGLFLTQPPTIEQVKNKRLRTQYYEKIMQGDLPITINDIKQMLARNNNINMNNFDLSLQPEPSKHSLDPNIPPQLSLSISQSEHSQLQYNSQLIKQSLQRYEQLEDIKLSKSNVVVKFTPEQIQVEKQIANALFTLPQDAKRKIMGRIPLKIIARLMRVRNQASNCSSLATVINLDL